MRASRLLSILMILQARGRVTAEAMAAEFEVSVRTIYRDVDELSASGVPVHADRGPGGGFALREGYRTQLTGLTPDEAETLLLAGVPGALTDLGFGSALASAERKLLAALPQGQASRAAASRQRVLLDPLDWYRRVEQPRFLTEVARAVWNQTRVAVRYESWKGRRSRTLDPLGLVLKGGVWYLVARVETAVRTYRVGRITTLKSLEGTFEPPARFHLAKHWAAELARFDRERVRGHATVRVGEGALTRIERLGADAAEAVRASRPDREGVRTATIPIESVEHAAIELLGLGPHLEVVAPPELAHRVRELALAVTRVYEAPRSERSTKPRPSSTTSPAT